MPWKALSIGERARLAVWSVAIGVTSGVAIRIAVHKAIALQAETPDGTVSRHFVVWWVAITLVALIGLASLGGALVFRRDRGWRAAPWALAAVVALGVGFLFAVADQMSAGAPLCHAPAGRDCDIDFTPALVAFVVCAAPPMAVAFAAAFGLRRLLWPRPGEPASAT